MQKLLQEMNCAARREIRCCAC